MQPVNASFLNSENLDAEPAFPSDRKTVYDKCYSRAEHSGSDICVSHLTESKRSEPIVVKEASSKETRFARMNK